MAGIAVEERAREGWKEREPVCERARDIERERERERRRRGVRQGTQAMITDGGTDIGTSKSITLFIHSIHIHSIHMLSLPTCQHPSASDVAQTYLIVGNHALGAGFMHTEVWRRKCKLGPTKKFPVRFLLGWPEFIFPPPHLSLKTPYPQGVVSYDQPALVHACMQAHEQLPRAL